MMPTVPTSKEGSIAKGFDMGSIEKMDATRGDHTGMRSFGRQLGLQNGVSGGRGVCKSLKGFGRAAEI